MGVVTRAGDGAAVNIGVGMGATFTGSWDTEGVFDGVPGFGGSDGWRALGAPIGRACGTDKTGGEGPSDFVASDLGSTDPVIAGGTLAVAAAAARCLAIFSRRCLFSKIRSSSSLIFFAKSLTSPGLW